MDTNTFGWRGGISSESFFTGAALKMGLIGIGEALVVAPAYPEMIHNCRYYYYLFTMLLPVNSIWLRN
jgi:hypothetical protein